MKVREAIAELMKLPPEHEIMDEYEETVLTGFYPQDGEDGPYVAYDTQDVED